MIFKIKYCDIIIYKHFYYKLQDSKVLKLDQLSASWWQTNGPGCKATVILTDSGLPKPDNITDCLFNYVHVEVFQAGLQCFLAVRFSISYQDKHIYHFARISHLFNIYIVIYFYCIY